MAKMNLVYFGVLDFGEGFCQKLKVRYTFPGSELSDILILFNKAWLTITEIFFFPRGKKPFCLTDLFLIMLFM